MPLPNYWWRKLPHSWGPHCDIYFYRTGRANANGSVPGWLFVGGQGWPTIERGGNHTWVRKGLYTLTMTVKDDHNPETDDRHVNCLSFNESPAIQRHLIHDAFHDDHEELVGCIAPGLTADDDGIYDSAAAMNEIWTALGGFAMWRRVTCHVENNIRGNETKEEWIRRREGRR
jgi:hypothetical protein